MNESQNRAKVLQWIEEKNMKKEEGNGIAVENREWFRLSKPEMVEK